MKAIIFYAGIIMIGVMTCMNKLDQQRYITWESLEPDKWASIWLIKTHIDPDAEIMIGQAGEKLEDGVTFGMPDAIYKRSATQSTFESLRVGYGLEDPVLEELGKIITQIETTAWSIGNDPLVSDVEQKFRLLQEKYSRAYVPIGCYGDFFDQLYSTFKSKLIESLQDDLQVAIDNVECDFLADGIKRSNDHRVEELPINQLLAEIASGKNVVFVDTRESQEYTKTHIPGAINLPMRELSEDNYQQLKRADRVISYCVKDFRGYEVARDLLHNGVMQVAVMKPHGLSGWVDSGLPVVREDAINHAQASQLLKKCAMDRTQCKKLIDD